MAHRKGRSASTAAGIVLGVAIFFGVLVTNSSLDSAIDGLAADFSGRADVNVVPAGAFDARLSAGAVEQVRALPGVAAVSGTLGVPASIDGHGGIFLIGVDIAADRRIRVYELRDGRDPATDQMLVPAAVAKRLGLRTGSRVTVRAPSGPRTMVVSGVLEPKGVGRTEGDEDSRAIVQLATARTLLGRQDTIGRIAVDLSEGTDAAAWVRDHRDALGDEARITRSGEETSAFRQVATLMGSFLAFFAAMTMFVGAFLIYLTLSMAVVERTRTYATLRALGSTRAQVARVVLTEAVVLGAVCSLAGLAVGLVLARGLLVLVGAVFEIHVTSISVSPGAAVAAFVLGLVVTLLSSLVPALRAGRVTPVSAMRDERRSGMRQSRSWIAGAAMIVPGAALSLVSDPVAVGFVGTLLLLFGAALVVPVVLRPLASVLGVLTRRIAPGIGNVAVLHLVKEQSRSGYTLALVMVVMAMLFSVGGVYASMLPSLQNVVDRQFGADLQVQAGGPIDPDLERAIDAREGVRATTALRFGSTDVGGRRYFVVAIDPDTYFDVSGFPWVRGDDATAREAFRRGGAVVVPDPVASDLGRRVTMKGNGTREFEVVGTVASFDTEPTLIIGVRDGRELLRLERPAAMFVDLEEGVDVAAAKAGMLRDLGSQRRLTILSASEAKAEAQQQLDQVFRVVYAILAVAALVGLLGLANTLVMSVLHRIREIGVLRAIGVTRQQLARIVLVESATLGGAAFVLSIPLGGLLSWFSVAGTRSSFGFTIDFHYPFTWIPVIFAFAAFTAVVAAIAPGRRAARLAIVEALQYE